MALPATNLALDGALKLAPKDIIHHGVIPRPERPEDGFVYTPVSTVVLIIKQSKHQMQQLDIDLVQAASLKNTLLLYEKAPSTLDSLPCIDISLFSLLLLCALALQLPVLRLAHNPVALCL